MTSGLTLLPPCLPYHDGSLCGIVGQEIPFSIKMLPLGILLHFISFICIHTPQCACRSAYVTAEDNRSLLSACGSWGSNLGPQAWQQVPSPLSLLSILFGVFYHSNRKGRKRTGRGGEKQGGRKRSLSLQLQAKKPPLGLPESCKLWIIFDPWDHTTYQQCSLDLSRMAEKRSTVVCA